MGVLASVKQLRKCTSDIVISVIQGGTKDSVTAIWLIYCLNCCQFFWPNCHFCHYMFTSFQSLILEPGFCDSGEAWETTAFPQTRGRQRTWREGSVPGRPHRVLLSYRMEAEIGVMQPQTKEQLESPEAGRGREGIFPRLFRGSTVLLTP